MKKVLIITYYWPPAGGGGVQRWLKFIKYLPDNGIKPIIAIPDNPEYPIQDPSLEKDVSKDTETLRIPIWEPYSLFKIFTQKKKEEKVNTGLLGKAQKKSLAEKTSLWIRGNILIPDPRIFWVRPAVKQIKRYLEKYPVDTIITTGPPHSVHLIGLKLKKQLGLKWLADFRDPWSEIDYLEIFKPSHYAMKRQRHLERKVLTRADKVITVSHNWAKDLERLGAKNVKVITNGYDSEDFKPAPIEKKSDKIVMLYSGILHDYRNPEYLWNIIEDMLEADQDFANKFTLRLFGTIDKQVIAYILNLSKLSERFIYGGYVSHDEILKEYQKADLLLLLQNDTKNALGHIPGKVFEYMASGRPILAIADKESDIAKILKTENAGVVLDKANIEAFNRELSDLFSSISVKNRRTGNKENIEARYSRRALTRQLVELIMTAK